MVPTDAQLIRRHLACVGAVIMILAQGFETFSSEMIGFSNKPVPLTHRSSMVGSPAPAPPRAETWHNIVPRGKGSALFYSPS